MAEREYYLIGFQMGANGFTHSEHRISANSPEEAAEKFAGRPLSQAGKHGDLVCQVFIPNSRPVRSLLFYNTAA